MAECAVSRCPSTRNSLRLPRRRRSCDYPSRGNYRHVFLEEDRGGDPADSAADGDEVVDLAGVRGHFAIRVSKAPSRIACPALSTSQLFAVWSVRSRRRPPYPLKASAADVGALPGEEGQRRLEERH